MKERIFELDNDGKELLTISIPVVSLATIFSSLISFFKKDAKDTDSNYYFRYKGNFIET